MFTNGIPPRYTRIVQGAGTLKQLPSLVTELGAKRVLLVTDPGLMKAGHSERAKNALQLKGISVCLFTDVAEGPTTADIADCAKAVEGEDIDLIIGLGGGSSIDTAKGANFLITNGGEMRDYRGDHPTKKPMLPFIAIPTTTGTGSEAQRFAVVSDAETKLKMACGSAGCAPKVSILDPELVESQPQIVAAMAGIDALSHAVETRVTRARNPVSDLYSNEAWDLLIRHLPAAFAGEATPEDWAALQWGSCLAGMAIEASMLGAAHAAANPLSASYGVLHGQAVGNLLPVVMRYNCEPEDRIKTVEDLLVQSGLQTSMSALGMQPVDIPGLANAAMLQWTGQFNPKKVNSGDFTDIYQAVM